MRKFIPYIVSAIIAIQAFTPPFEMAVRLTNSPLQFVWIFLLCGFLSIYFIFTKANIFLKVLLPYLFINCFLSAAPWISYTSFVWVAVAAYFYLLCLEIEDWEPVFKTVICILLVEEILVILSAFSKDTLYNFGQTQIICIGSVGNMMQFKSLMLILAAIAIQRGRGLRKYLPLIYLSLILTAICYFFFHHVGPNFMYARGPVWFDALNLAGKHPVIGWGLGAFKATFASLAHGAYDFEGSWTNAHSFPVQMFYEIGRTGYIILAAYAISLASKCRGMLLLGALLVGFTLLFHFPDREPSTALLIILFIALIERKHYAIPS